MRGSGHVVLCRVVLRAGLYAGFIGDRDKGTVCIHTVCIVSMYVYARARACSVAFVKAQSTPCARPSACCECSVVEHNLIYPYHTGTHSRRFTSEGDWPSDV